jgi:3-methyladenine DNA glycosylase AlkC
MAFVIRSKTDWSHLALADTEDFVTLSTQFETLMKQLKNSYVPETRQQILGHLRLVIQKLDVEIVKQHPDLKK